MRAPPVTTMAERPVKSEDHALDSGRLGSLHASDHGVAITSPVDLEERRATRLCNLFDRRRCKRRKAQGDAASRSRTTDRNFTLRMDRLDTGRRDHHRHGRVLAHNRGLHRALWRLAGSDRTKANFIERCSVVAHRQACLCARDQRAVHALGNPLLRPLLSDRDRLEPLVRHGLTSDEIGS